MSWVPAFGYIMAAVGFVLLGALLIHWLFRKDVDRNDENRRRLAVAVEDERNDPTDDLATGGLIEPGVMYGFDWNSGCVLPPLRRLQGDLRSPLHSADPSEYWPLGNPTPDEVDPPTSRLYLNHLQCMGCGGDPQGEMFCVRCDIEANTRARRREDT